MPANLFIVFLAIEILFVLSSSSLCLATKKGQTKK